MSDWLISSARLRTGKHPENIDVSDIFSWSTYVSHKYMLSFLSSLSELHVVSKWLFTWYRNDFHFNSGMSFVPECSSHFIHKIERLSLRRSRSRGRFRPRSGTNASPAPGYTICDFQSGTKFIFSLHDTRMKFPRPRKRISFAVETGMDPRLSLLRSFVDKWLSPTYYEGRICLYLTILGINAIDLLFKVTVNTESVIDASLVWINPIAAWNKQTICEES